MRKNIAVFTGDLVRSTKASRAQVEATIANIAETADRLGNILGTNTKFTRYRGDGWQFVVEEPGAFLLAAVMVNARLRMVRGLLRTRASIGVGEIDSLGTHGLSDASGWAFTISGRGLESTSRDRDWVKDSTPEDEIGLLGQTRQEVGLLGNVDLYDSILLNLVMFNASKWTAAQAEAVALALEHDGETQGVLADRLGISRQALNLRLTSAGYGPIRGAVVFSRIMASKIDNEAATHD